MSTRKPLISICIPTYNGEKFLQEVFDSIVTQTYTHIEVIISDDNSSDGTVSLCKTFQKQANFPVQVFEHIPAGIGANWNNCIRHSNGEYVKFIFQDDVLYPNTVEMQMNALKAHNLKAVFSKRTIIDQDSRDINSGEWFESYGDLQNFLNLPKFRDVHVIKKNVLSRFNSFTYNIFGEPDTFLYHRSIFSSVGLFNTHYKQIIDLEFSYRILEKHPILFQAESLLKFRLHNDQESNKNLGKNLKEFKILEKYVKRKFFLYIHWKIKVKFVARTVYDFFKYHYS